MVLMPFHIIQGVIQKDHEGRMVEAPRDQRKKEEPERLFPPHKFISDHTHRDRQGLAQAGEDHDEGRHIHEQDDFQKTVLLILRVDHGDRDHRKSRDHYQENVKII